MSTLQDGFRGPDYELVVGRIRGLRRWYVKADGQLVGAHDHKWTTGEQSMECMWAAMKLPTQWTDAMKRHDYESALKIITAHQMEPLKLHDMRECTCGFYAYHTADAAFGAGLMTLGMMEGWGRATVGELGFRCEKARVIALVRPWWTMGNSWYAMFSSCMFVGAVLLNVWVIANALIAGGAFPWWSIFAIGLNIAALCLAVNTGGVGMTTTAKIREQYPDVQIFRTKRGMLKAFPLEKVN